MTKYTSDKPYTPLGNTNQNNLRSTNLLKHETNCRATSSYKTLTEALDHVKNDKNGGEKPVTYLPKMLHFKLQNLDTII